MANIDMVGLAQACLDLAAAVLDEPRIQIPNFPDVTPQIDAVTQLAAAYGLPAQQLAEVFPSALVIRGIEFITHFGMLPEKNMSPEWFMYTLITLLAVTASHLPDSSEGMLFLSDLKRGVDLSLEILEKKGGN